MSPRNGRQADGETGHAGDLLELFRQATRGDGLPRALRWLSRRIGAWVALVDASGTELEPDGSEPPIEVATAVELVAAGRPRTAFAEWGAFSGYVIAVGDGRREPILIVARQGGFEPDVHRLITDAARVVELAWRVSAADRRHDRLRLAEARTREAVLHLLMIGDVSAARRVAAALSPPLAERVRVHVIQCAPGARRRALESCEQDLAPDAWIVPCPVYSRHIIVLGSVAADVTGGRIDDMLRGALADCTAGTSEARHLAGVPSGYVQAFHALRAASAGRRAVYNSRGDLAALLDSRSTSWALSTLDSLLTYVPPRAQDPRADELVGTLRSWLTLAGGAAAQLKVHRNTVAARIHTIEELLGWDLGDLAVQTTAWLALRVIAAPRLTGTPSAGGRDGEIVALDDLLFTPPVLDWARAQLRPLAAADVPYADETLRGWLDAGGNLAATAQSLELSVPAVRKRLIRLEQLVRRSLLSAPSAKYSLFLATRVVDHFGGETRRSGIHAAF